MVGDRQDPLVSFQYRINLADVITGYFTECSGLGSETDVVEHKTLKGTEDVIEMMPGRRKWSPLKLKRGITDNLDFWEWRQRVDTGGVSEARLNGTISMLDQEGNEVARWDFVNAWPSKVSGPELKADSNAVGIEEITIVHEGIKRVQ